jgi:hypothetical protein
MNARAAFQRLINLVRMLEIARQDPPFLQPAAGNALRALWADRWRGEI